MTPFAGLLELEGGTLVPVSGEIRLDHPTQGMLALEPGSLAGIPVHLLGCRARLLIVGHPAFPVRFYGTRRTAGEEERLEFVSGGPDIGLALPGY